MSLDQFLEQRCVRRPDQATRTIDLLRELKRALPEDQRKQWTGTRLAVELASRGFPVAKTGRDQRLCVGGVVVSNPTQRWEVVDGRLELVPVDEEQ
jgi:hypothetical protein